LNRKHAKADTLLVMSRPPARRNQITPFDRVRTVGLVLPGVEAATKYDGSPVLKVGGAFLAGVATHPSAEPETLVVRSGFEERELLLEEAPDTYYVTDHYRKHPVVLVRLSRLDTDALRDLLSMSWRLTMAKGRARAEEAR
jgi:hypothetical protein